MAEREPSESPVSEGRMSDEMSARVTNDPHQPVTPSFRGRSDWLFQVLRVRLRFLLIVVIAGTIVSQWPVIRGLWDRWTWVFGRQQNWGSVSSANEYFCPMDPGVISVWPAICPICNMDLVPRKKMDAVMLPEGVVARMQLSPYRIQLAGIRTTVVEPRRLEFEQTFTGVVRKMENGSLGFDASLPASLRSFFAEARSATVRTVATSGTASATIGPIKSNDSPIAQVVLDDSTIFEEGSAVIAAVQLPYHDAEDVLTVPESAVVNRGYEQLVYVETMPGVFDGVSVELGPRCGGYYPVTKGLKALQRVATAGAFLIDAETRLNPSLAAGYFGANQGESKTYTPPAAPAIKSPSAKPESPKKSNLSREDQTLVDKQRICPVTELPLSSMGGPLPVLISGRKIFICCQGCEKRLKDEPEKYLARIPQ